MKRLSRIIKEESCNYFIEVLATMRFPSIKAVIVKTYHRTLVFLKEAVHIFILAAAAIFVFEKTGVLNTIEQLLIPITVKWMGLPRQIVEVFIVGLARREAAAGLILTMVNAGTLNYIQSIVAVVVTTTCFPCFVNLVVMTKEIGIKTTILISSLICVSSFLLVGLLRWVLVLTIGY